MLPTGHLAADPVLTCSHFQEEVRGPGPGFSRQYPPCLSTSWPSSHICISAGEHVTPNQLFKPENGCHQLFLLPLPHPTVHSGLITSRPGRLCSPPLPLASFHCCLSSGLTSTSFSQLPRRPHCSLSGQI